jgi:hypothetical protein
LFLLGRERGPEGSPNRTTPPPQDTLWRSKHSSACLYTAVFGNLLRNTSSRVFHVFAPVLVD